MKNSHANTSLTARLAAIALSAALLAPLAAKAGDREQNELQREVERGQVRPLSEILAVVRNRIPGDVVKVEVERRDRRWLYEIRIVDASGRVFEIYVDANSAAIERIKEK